MSEFVPPNCGAVFMVPVSKSDVRDVTVEFAQIAAIAGFHPDASGKLNLPPTQEVAEQLASAAVSLFPWQPGDPPTAVVLTGPGPVWAYLCIAHALHGRVVRLTYSAPNATIDVWRHGV